MPTYSELLRHPLWQKKRLEVLSLHNFRCQECHDDEVPLHVHHGYYEKGKKPWEYDTFTLHCLCEDCHLQFEETLGDIRQMMAEIGSLRALEMLRGYIFGLQLDFISPNATYRSTSQWAVEGLADQQHVTVDSLMSLCRAGEIDCAKISRPEEKCSG